MTSSLSDGLAKKRISTAMYLDKMEGQGFRELISQCGGGGLGLTKLNVDWAFMTKLRAFALRARLRAHALHLSPPPPPTRPSPRAQRP